MGRPLRFPLKANYVDKAKWPHVVAVHGRLLSVSARADDILCREVELWLRANVRRGGWRFSTRTEMLNVENSTWPGRLTLRIDIFFQVHLSQENDALAFRMRWG